MLLRFSFSNFRSFLDEQELSLVGSSIKGKTQGRPIAGVPGGVLPVAAIYGANASGKTNVLRALEFMAGVVRNSHARWEPDQGIPRTAFLGMGALPSRFVADLEIDGTRYQYGFVVDANGVREEWLYAYPESGRKQNWFKRTGESPIVFGAKMRGDNRAIASLTRKNSLLLSTAAQNNHAMLTPIYRWFARSVSFVDSDRWLWVERVADSCGFEEFKSFAIGMLGAADLGIGG